MWSFCLKQLVIFGFLVSAVASAAPKKAPFHFDLDASSAELARLVAKKPKTRFSESTFEPIFKLGKRNLAWLAEINSHRQEPISLYHKDELNGSPIDKPTTYGPSTIWADYQDLQKTMNAQVAAILFSEDKLPPTAPVEDEEYRTWAKKTDRLYQITLRWTLFEDYLDYYADQKFYDVRGYYFLSLKADLKYYLAQFNTYSSEEQIQIKTWVRTVCWNATQSEARCQTALNKAGTDFYAMVMKYWSAAKANYDAFNEIPLGAKNRATHAEGDMLVSSVQHSTDALDAFSKFNIEEEWNNLGLKFLLQITNGTANMIRWEPDVTPHANGLGGNTVVMNSRSSLEDWDTQWTIRHEYGHLLGLPDCYFEFYDPVQGVMISYQFDVNDLMCSRKGKLTPRIVNEIKKVYF